MARCFGFGGQQKSPSFPLLPFSYGRSWYYNSPRDKTPALRCATVTSTNVRSLTNWRFAAFDAVAYASRPYFFSTDDLNTYSGNGVPAGWWGSDQACVSANGFGYELRNPVITEVALDAVRILIAILEVG